MKNTIFLLLAVLMLSTLTSCIGGSEVPDEAYIANQAKTYKAPVVDLNSLVVKGDIRHLDVENFHHAILKKLGPLVDVRTAKEFQSAHMAGAINIDIKNSNFKTEASKLNKEKPIVIYCRSGARSGSAMKVLEKLGYTVYNLDGGFLDWKAKGMWIEK